MNIYRKIYIVEDINIYKCTTYVLEDENIIKKVQIYTNIR